MGFDSPWVHALWVLLALVLVMRWGVGMFRDSRWPMYLAGWLAIAAALATAWRLFGPFDVGR
jgi:hypothetical protein